MSQFFNIAQFAVYYFIFVILFIIYWFNNKPTKDRFFKIYDHFVKIGIIYALIGFVYAFLKYTVNMPRPFCSEIEGVSTIIKLSEERCLSSFPSAHTAIVILCSYSLWPVLKSYQKLFGIILCILVMLSRIILAMHFPADILYSLIIVFLIIKLGEVIYSLLKDNLIKAVGRFIYSFFGR